MKFRYIFAIVISAVLAFASCNKMEPVGSLDNITLDKTFVTIPVDGGDASVVVNATEGWYMDTTYTQDVWPNVVTRKADENGKKTIYDKKVPSWLGVNAMSGGAGQTTLVFSADAVAGGRELELCIKVGSQTQFIKVRQGSLEAESATCADVIAGPDGKTYKIKGVCTSIANTQYGNWYLNDGTGEVYIYGTLDAKGAEKNFSSLGIEAGDIVEVSGPKTTYNGTIELVNVTVHKVTKSLLKLIEDNKTLEKEGGKFVAKIAYKGNGVFVNIPDSVAAWVSLSNMEYKSGVPTKIEPNPADTAVVTFVATDNTKSVLKRRGAISFSSNSGKSSSNVTLQLEQKGNEPAKVDIKDCFGQTYTHIKGEVMAVDSDYGYILSDGTANILIYKSDYTKDASTKDKIKVLGEPGVYNYTGQIQDPDLEEKDGYNKDWKRPEPTVYDLAKMEEQMAKVKGKDKAKDRLVEIEYVTYTGTLKVDGKYLNILFEGDTKAQGSLYVTTDLKEDDVKALDGKKVKVTGYFFQLSSGKFFNTMATAVEEVK